MLFPRMVYLAPFPREIETEPELLGDWADDPVAECLRTLNAKNRRMFRNGVVVFSRRDGGIAEVGFPVATEK